jgi:vacuolar-type H+-ATPase subunit I/STV1
LRKKLRDSCRALNKTDFSAGASGNVVSKLKKFTESYNKLTEAAKKSDDKSLKKQADSITKLIKENEKALRKAGITFDEDKNSLKLNDETLEKIKSGKVYDSLFTGNTSFITKVQKIADKTYKLLKDETVTKEVSVTQNIELGDNERANAITAGALYSSITSLESINYSNSSMESLKTLINSFTENYNNLIHSNLHDDGDDDKAEANNERREELMNNIRNTNNDYSSQLSSIGININDDGSFAIDDDILENASTDDVGSLFGKDAEYSKEMSTNLNLLFANLSGANGTGQAVNVTA